ncbi:MAG TPA: translation elongation factor 4 [Candidatus Saccharimonadales bacterium]|nr:translation elongation factor 4 [Candidatus Saccharimonadales bacterium]
MTQINIRNFCIIAHIDHGKSTLADRMMEITGTVEKRDMKSQLLDSMDLEREKGITIKLAPVRMDYKGHELNLIDTPGHVDFSYEVSRSLEACEGAILVVDASQGIQAQTLANVYLALAADLTIIPVLNKIDLPAADVPRVSEEIVNLLGCSEDDILKISAKTGDGVSEVLDAVIDRLAPPQGIEEAPTRALIFDSYYDDYRGVILYVRVVDGEIPKNAHIHMLATNAKGLALEVGALKPKMTPSDALRTGDIGYIVTNLKSTREAKVGDTVSLVIHGVDSPSGDIVPLPGYQNVKPFVYAGFFPESNEYYQELKDAVEKLSLSDSALQFTPENSPVLGFGVRIGFLGLLHMEIVRERLEREYSLRLIVTNPSTDYQVILSTGDELDIKSASELPDMAKVAEIKEPWIKGEIVVPREFIGPVVQLIVARRGLQRNISYLDDRLALITFDAPLANVLTNFYDQLKSSTSGYGSFNYELTGYEVHDLVRLDFYVAGEMVDALSLIVHRTEAPSVGREVVGKLKEVIPRQQFPVPLQAAIGGKFIAREDISAYRKDVTGYLYGGDVSRKKKLLAKQKRGKARMKRFGKVDIPAEAFTVLLKQ